MKISFKSAFLAIASLGLFLSSCSTSIEVAKRKHRKGYHVSISKNKIEKTQLRSERIFAEAAVDSPSVDTVKIEPMILDQSSEMALVDSPSVDTLKTDRLLSDFKTTIALNQESKTEKPSFLQKVKAVNKVRKQFKNLRKDSGFKTASSDEDWEIDSDLVFILMVVIAILLPPIVVYLIKGKSNAFILNLILWLIGLGLAAILLPNIIYLGGLLAIIHALLVLLGHS